MATTTATGSDHTPGPRNGLTQQLVEPLRAFLAAESSSAGLLLFAAVAALVWANSPWSESYETLWSTELVVRFGDAEIAEDLRRWVNDGLMVFFFFVVGLEVRRELSMGEFTQRRLAAVPIAGAIAGIAVPAAIYLALNPSGEAARGWGAAMATDTAFVLGALLIVGPRFPTRLRAFLLTLAVVDDIVALGVIAVFYSDDLHPPYLLLAAACVLVAVVLGRLHVGGAAYFLVGLVLWLATLESGVHPSIAGVVLGLSTTAFPPARAAVEEAASRARAFRQSPVPSLARSTKLLVDRAISPNERIQLLLLPWTSYVIVPLFALANAGIRLDRETVERAATSPVTLGVVAGLVIGKFAGISAAILGSVRLRLGELPSGVSSSQIYGGAALSGIGFTVSLFVIDLAFDSPRLAEEATIGVLAASVLATAFGWIVFRITERGPNATRERVLLDPPVDLDRDHFRGPRDAPMVLVEYGDFACDFCARATGVMKELRARFGDDLTYVFRHLPQTHVHPWAETAAEAAEAAGAQGRFWDMHDLLFDHQSELEVPDLLGYAGKLGLDVERFARDIEDRTFSSRVRADVASAELSGASATPTFFIGGRRHTGPWDSETLTARLAASRARPETAAPIATRRGGPAAGA